MGQQNDGRLWKFKTNKMAPGLSWLSSSLPPEIGDHPTLGSTISFARKTLNSQVSSPPSAVTPVIGNPKFSLDVLNENLCRLPAIHRLSVTE